MSAPWSTSGLIIEIPAELMGLVFLENYLLNLLYLFQYKLYHHFFQIYLHAFSYNYIK